MIDHVVIWGHKFNHYHTHSHIHSSYYKAFKAMGFDTLWLDNDDALSGLEFTKNTLFFTEAQVDQKIPLIHRANYILHHCKTEKYENAGCNILNLCNYVNFCEDGISFNYKETGNTVEKLGELFFYDEAKNAVYQPWATDLLPEEINEDDFCPFDPDKGAVNYVGSIWYENINQMRPFIKACEDNNKLFRNFGGGIPDAQNQQLIRDSFIAPDIRGQWHIDSGYLPCRIFKNISYGQVTGTNSPHVYKIFGDMVAFNPDTYGLFDSCKEKAMHTSAEERRSAMLFIKENHTYINRINNLLYILSEF